MPKRSAKQKLIQIPNICPFKEKIIEEVEADKARREEEKQQKIEKLKLERQEAKKKNTLESMVIDAENRAESHVEKEDEADNLQGSQQRTKENSLKSYFKEFKKVVDAADVILEVCDARDPLGLFRKEKIKLQFLIANLFI